MTDKRKHTAFFLLIPPLIFHPVTTSNKQAKLKHMKQKFKKRFHCYLHPDCLGTSYSWLCVLVPPEDSSLMGQLIQPLHPGSPYTWLALWSINWLYPLAGRASPLPSPLRISTNPSGIIKGSQRRGQLLIFPPCRLRKGERMSWEVSALLLMDVTTSSSKLLGKSCCLSIGLHTVQSWKGTILIRQINVDTFSD